jgi:hypothetical protein
LCAEPGRRLPRSQFALSERRLVYVDVRGSPRGAIAELGSELNDLEGIVDVYAGDAKQFSY